MKISDKDLVTYILSGALRYDKNGRPNLSVPTSVRRNSSLLIPMKRIKKLAEIGLISKEDILKIRPY